MALPYVFDPLQANISGDVGAGEASPWTASPGLTGEGQLQAAHSSNFTLSANVTGEPLTNDTHSVGMPQYYDMLYRVIGCAFVSVIFVVGFVGNVMVVIVVSRTRSMHNPTNCYLVSLAVADILLLVSAPLPTIWEFFLIIDQHVLGAAGCSIMVFFQYFGVNVSSMSITAFTIERYIAICHPMKAQTMCTLQRAKRIIAALWLFGLAYCAPWLALTTIQSKTYIDGTTIQSCTFRLPRNSYVTIYMCDLVIFYVIPLLLTCILYGLIGRILFTTTITATPGKAEATNGACKGKNSKGSRKSTGVSSRVQVSVINLFTARLDLKYFCVAAKIL